MAKKIAKQKLTKATWAIAWRPFGCRKRNYYYENRHVMLFRTRADAWEAVREGPEWVQKLSEPVRVDVVER